ncbi:MAG TPA: FAD-dependent oxidoreductase, partial [Cytophagaceae bacterium]|nr:FAD-dependent oxidoreductase [Cytophagaceae bacterium]
MKKTIIVVGNGMVGYKFCEKLVEKKANETYNIIVFGEEPRPAYDRVHLSEYFSGKTADDLLMAPLAWYQENNITLIIGDQVISIDRENKLVISKSGNEVTYDKLVLATGSSCFIPPVNGIDKKGVIPYRTIEDLDLIRTYAKKCKKGAVIGGGLLGLEAAKALLDLGLETHVVEFASRLMPRQLDDAGSLILKEKLEKLSISIHLNKNTELIYGDGKVEK